MGAHIPRAFQEWAAARGQSSAILFVDIRAAYYTVLRSFAFGPEFADEEVGATLQRLGLSDVTIEEVARNVLGAGGLREVGGWLAGGWGAVGGWVVVGWWLAGDGWLLVGCGCTRRVRLRRG